MILAQFIWVFCLVISSQQLWAGSMVSHFQHLQGLVCDLIAVQIQNAGVFHPPPVLKGSYDAFLKIIILCIWCNRICWHALMFKKHIIFQILYIIVSPLCPASLKRFVFYKAPSSDKHSLRWLANWHSALWLAEHHKHFPLSRALAFKIIVKTFNNVVSFTISSSPRGEQSRMTDTVMMLACICTQAAIKTISDRLYTPLWCDSLSLSHTHTSRD